MDARGFKRDAEHLTAVAKLVVVPNIDGRAFAAGLGRLRIKNTGGA